MTTDTQRGASGDLVRLLEARRAALDEWLREHATFDGHANGLADFDAFSAVVIAAERRRQARNGVQYRQDIWQRELTQWAHTDVTNARTVLAEANDAEDACLEALTVHLTTTSGEGR